MVALEIRKRVFEATNLTCSAGIGPNRMIAKICSDIDKPDGQTYCPPDKEYILNFIGEMSVRKIPNIGPMRETTLDAMGIKTGKDMQEKAMDLMLAFREIEHTFLMRCSLGLGQLRHNE